MKSNDIYVAAYPKSGITWLSFLLATARLRYNNMAMLPTFYNIDWLVIDSHKMGELEYANIWNDGMGNFIKTHAHVPAANAIYLLRNPYDTLKSYYHFEKRVGGAKDIDSFLKVRCSQWCDHVRNWLIDSRYYSQSLYLIEYENLSSASVCALGMMLGFNWRLGDNSKICDRKSMRDSELWFAKNNPVYARYEIDFVREGNKREVEGFEAYREFIEECCGAVYRCARGQVPSLTLS